jgi:hypothetical protein
MTQVGQKLEEKALKPIVQGAVTAGFEAVKNATFTGMGTAVGQAAAPPIADSVGKAVANLPIRNDSTLGMANDPGHTIANALFADGGPVTGGVPLKDSVPALLMPNEYVFDTKTVAKMGGVAGVDRFRAAVLRGAVRHFASGGSPSSGKNVNDVVGAQFFGVDQIPIIGAIVNLIVRVLLQLIGVTIQQRDTLVQLSSDFRGFRGDAFKAFDAQGRLFNDTSGLVDRNTSSESEVADERIRILKIVLDALIKYIIEKVIVPIAKAVAQAAVSVGSSVAGAAVSSGINAGAGGGGQLVGGIVESVINSAGQAAIDITAEVGTDLAESLITVVLDVIGEALPSLLPGLTTAVFGGGAVEGLTNPVGALLQNLIGAPLGLLESLFNAEGPLGSLLQILVGLPIGGGAGGLLGTLLSLLGAVLDGGGLFGGLFDDGGLAAGIGLMPKATIAPERVLSPSQTAAFEDWMRAGARGASTSTSTTTIHAPFTVLGGQQAGEQVRDRLLALMS